MGDEDWSAFYDEFGIDMPDDYGGLEPGYFGIGDEGGEAVSDFTVDDDPYANWGGGAGGDGQPPGTEGTGAGFGDSDFWKMLGSGGGMLKNLLFGSASQGGLGLTLRDLLGAGAGALGTMNQNKMSKEAVKMIQDAATEAQKQGREIIGGAAAKFDPFINTGTKANADLYAMIGNSNLADRYKPLDVSQAMKGIPAFKPLTAYTSLADLAKVKR